MVEYKIVISIDGEQMKKIILSFMMICLTLTFFGCKAKTYDDIYQTYTSYLDTQFESYETLMETYNHLTYNVMQTVVTVKGTSPDIGYGSTGSCVIFAENDDFVYVLTIIHVIIFGDTTYRDINIIDAFGHTHTSTLITYDLTFDLAALKIAKKTYDLPTVAMADVNLDVKTNVAVLGHPNGQANAITIGYFFNMTTIDLEGYAVSQVEFPVLKLNVPVQSGSSGSVVVNEEGLMVGLIFAGNNDLISPSYAIPIEEVYRFLEEHDVLGGDEA